MSRPSGKFRILHVSPGLVFGGIENWLFNVIHLVNRETFSTDVAVTGEIDARVRSRFESMGVRVFPCPAIRKPVETVRNLSRILRDRGPYDLMHCHLHRGNGYAALTGRIAGVPRIVVHSHGNTAPFDGKRLRTKLAALASALAQRITADAGLACAGAAGDYLFDRHWRSRADWRVLFCGMDLHPFTRAVDRSALREQFGLPPDAFVIGTVGRCEADKNHGLVIDIAMRYTERNANAYFLIAGDGSMRTELERRVRLAGRTGRIRFLGARDDVPDLFLGVFDAFLFPSLAEGLPIALLEAQAAGLPAVISERMPPEALVLPGIEVLRIGRQIEDWCDALDRARGIRLDPQTATAALRVAGFDVEDSARALEKYYRGLLRPI